MADVQAPHRRTTWAEREVPSFYANIVGFSMSPFDITLLFGEIESGTPTEVKAIPRAKITIPAEQALGLQQLLEIALETFVKGNGPLRNVGKIDAEDIRRQLAQVLTEPKP